VGLNLTDTPTPFGRSEHHQAYEVLGGAANVTAVDAGLTPHLASATPFAAGGRRVDDLKTVAVSTQAMRGAALGGRSTLQPTAMPIWTARPRLRWSYLAARERSLPVSKRGGQRLRLIDE